MITMKNNIKSIREAQNMTQNDLAMATNLAVVTINNLEEGITAPNLRTAYGICKILGKNIYHIWPNEMKVVTKTVRSVVLSKS